MSQDPPSSPLLANIPQIVVRGFATSLEVFLHRAPGSKYLGLQSAAPLLLVPGFAACWGEHDIEPLLWFLPAYLVMVVVARGGIAARALGGGHCHSMYSGWPRFLGPNARISEVTMKRFVEPLGCFLFGMVTTEYNVPLGMYILLSSGCLCLSVNESLSIQRRQAQELNDTLIEQEQIAEHFREMRGEE